MNISDIYEKTESIFCELQGIQDSALNADFGEVDVQIRAIEKELTEFRKELISEKECIVPVKPLESLVAMKRVIGITREIWARFVVGKAISSWHEFVDFILILNETPFDIEYFNHLLALNGLGSCSEDDTVDVKKDWEFIREQAEEIMTLNRDDYRDYFRSMENDG